MTETEQDEFEKTMVIPTGKQNAEQLAKAEKAAEKAVAKVANRERDVAASVRLDPDEASYNFV